MSRIMLDLAGADAARRFSPFCWRTRMALAHKDLPVETVPWRFTEPARLAELGQKTVPVLIDQGRVIGDSWDIACWLEDTYPDRPQLFGGSTPATRFINSWTDSELHPAVARLVLTDIHAALAPADQAYFRETREARFGMTLEQVSAPREGLLTALRRTLQPVRVTLRAQPFLCGEGPAYSDYIVFGAFMWARAVSPIVLLEADDPVEEWRQRLLDAHGGVARAAPAAAIYAR